MQSPSTKIGKTGSNGRLRAAVPNGKKLVIKPLKSALLLPCALRSIDIEKRFNSLRLSCIYFCFVQPKIMVTQNHLAPAAKPQLPASFEVDTWAKLLEAVHAVQNKRAVACSLEELYRVRSYLFKIAL